MIDKTAIISDDAQIAKSVQIGPYVTIGPNVKIGENVIIEANAHLEHCEIGDNTSISAFASIGTPPQDLGYKGEPTKSIVGKNCQIREYATINRASGEGNVTKVGDKCLLMTSAHVGHNCVVEDEVIMANVATLGGHCRVGFGAFIGGISVFHQNIRIGELCIISGFSAARRDIIPYCNGEGRPFVIKGINVIGLRRRGFSRDDRNAIHNAVRVLTSGKYLITDALKVIEDENLTNNKYVQNLLNFVKESKRGISFKNVKKESSNHE